MQIYKTIITAFKALRRNLMRSALTALGIIIGIAAVIALAQIGKGSAAAVRTQVKKMGANMLMVQPGAISTGGVNMGSGTRVTLTSADAAAIAHDCPDVRWATPIVHAKAQVIYGDNNWSPNLIDGTMPSYLNCRNWLPMAQGRNFTKAEVRKAAEVCVLGQTVVQALFGNESPIGKYVQVNNVSLQVIGVLTKKGANMMGWDQDDILVAPWTTIKDRIAATDNSKPATSTSSTGGATSSTASVNSITTLYPGSSSGLYVTPTSTQSADRPTNVIFSNVGVIMCSARSSSAIPRAIAEIKALMRQRHHLKPGQPNDFHVHAMTALANMLSNTTRTMTHLLLGVALISLLVGGVGIMNIMLVSVTERTREIGLRMAVGARARDILRQFLVEAIVLCLLGGALGILCGQGLASACHMLLHWPIGVSMTAIVAAVAVSACVGLIFGYYPAWKASRLDPIDALRYE